MANRKWWEWISCSGIRGCLLVLYFSCVCYVGNIKRCKMKRRWKKGKEKKRSRTKWNKTKTKTKTKMERKERKRKVKEIKSCLVWLSANKWLLPDQNMWSLVAIWYWIPLWLFVWIHTQDFIYHNSFFRGNFVGRRYFLICCCGCDSVFFYIVRVKIYAALA